MAQPGDKIGPYVIESLLAEGGMGAVYRARNRVTGQLRALKIIKEDLVKKGDFVERFVREASIASQVRHPNLVETLEPGIDGDTIYLPMELLQGETLHARLRRVKRMSPADTAAILGPVCEAIQVLHDRNLIHRDLKPMNVFLVQTPGGEIPKVLDLGTARDVADDEHTTTGMVVGSPYYMSPEQAEGRRDIDGRVDQYAVGVMAYQMITGQRPYESDDTRSALAKLMRGDPYVPPRRILGDLPDALEQVIVRALSRERDQRYPRAVDLGAALVAASVPKVAPIADPSIPSPRPPSPLTAAASNVALIPPSEPALLPEPASATFTPPPGVGSATPAARPAFVVPLAVAALALLGVTAAIVAWRFTAVPEVTTTELSHPAPTLPTVTVPPTSIPTTVEPTGAAIVVAAPPSDIAGDMAGDPTADRTGDPTGTAAPSDLATPPLVVDTEASTLPSESPRERGRRSRRGGTESSGATGASSTTSPSRGSRVPDDDAPCGAATGIPCLD